ncbi:MAG: hypothetical protein QOJ89_3841 [bacterium]|jgi:hypothetical protein
MGDQAKHQPRLDDVGFDTLGGTPEVVEETERRMAVDDAD